MLANQNADTINFTSEKNIVRPIKTLIRQISLVKNIVCGKIRILFHRFIARKSLYSYDKK